MLGRQADSAGEAGAVEGEAVDWAEDGDGNVVGLEVALREGLELLSGDGFDGGENFIEREEAAEVQLLAREIGHARTGGLEGKHQRALEMVLRTAQFFLGDQRFLQRAE